MPISFDKLFFAEPTLAARRLLWHALSIGSVWRDEPELHAGLDKAGLFLFHTVAGTGRLEVAGRCHPLARGDSAWLVDLRLPRSYMPTRGEVLRTEGVRFSGPGVESWLEVLGDDPVYALPAGRFRSRLRRLGRWLRQRGPGYEWQIHRELTELWGELVAARPVFTPRTAVPPAAARVIEAVLAEPVRSWRARELAAVAGRLNFSNEYYCSHWFHHAAELRPSEFRERCRA